MFRRVPAILAALGLLIAATAAPAAARPPFEPAYFNDQTVWFRVASSGSANPNQATVLCFNIGPDVSATERSASVSPLYVIFAPGATNEQCPDGSNLHDHVFSAGPGSPGYNGAVRIVAAMATGTFDPSVMPITSAAEVQALVSAGQLTLADTGITMIAHLVGGKG